MSQRRAHTQPSSAAAGFALLTSLDVRRLSHVLLDGIAYPLATAVNKSFPSQFNLTDQIP